MRPLNKEEIRKLNEVKSDIYISIYIPTHRSGEAVNNGKDVIMLKNQVQKAKNELVHRGLPEATAKEYLKEAYKLLEDTGFWRLQLDGLAVFIADDFFAYYRLPHSFEASLMISNTFNLKDLMPVVQGKGHYYILALSINKIRFFEATRHDINPIKTPSDMPGSLDEAMRYTEVTADIQRRGGNATGRVNQTVYHGQGAEDERDDFVLEDYLRRVSAAIFNMIKEEQAPLVLYGTDKIKYLYKSVNQYGHLLEKSVDGNPDEVKVDQIHQKTWDIVRDIFNEARENNIKKYDELAGTGKTSYDLARIVPAAANGRIEALFVTKYRQIWGKFHEENQSVEMHETRQEGDYCLLNKAVIDTFLNGGQVFTLDKEDLPEYSVETDSVAVMRF